MIWSADSLLRMLTKADMFLTEQEESHKEIVGELFCKTYIRLAQQALVSKSLVWRVRPKFHLMHHVCIESRNSRLNAHMWSTWMDEDWLKKICRVKKGCHRRTAAQQTIRRYLLGLTAKLQEAQKRLNG